MEWIDKLLTQLSKEFKTPKPDYAIYKVEEIKPLEKIKDSFPFASGFVYEKNICYLMFLNKVKKSEVVHEFFHFFYYMKNGCDNSDKTSADIEAEEKEINRLTREWLKNDK